MVVLQAEFPEANMGTGGALAKGRRALTRCNILVANSAWRVANRKLHSLLAICYSPLLNRSAAFGAKYVKIPSAPARLKPSRLSIIARSPSIQPLLAAAAIIAYSPETW